MFNKNTLTSYLAYLEPCEPVLHAPPSWMPSWERGAENSRRRAQPPRAEPVVDLREPGLPVQHEVPHLRHELAERLVGARGTRGARDRPGQALLDVGGVLDPTPAPTFFTHVVEYLQNSADISESLLRISEMKKFIRSSNWGTNQRSMPSYPVTQAPRSDRSLLPPGPPPRPGPAPALSPRPLGLGCK